MFRLEKRRFQAATLFALEDKRDRLVFWPYDADKHAAVCSKGVGF
jgi:hypothetical protein